MSQTKLKFNFTTLIYLLLLAAFSYWIYAYRGQIVDIVNVVSQGLWYYILATLLVLGLATYNQARWYASIYTILDIPSGPRDLLPVYLVRRFVTVAAPSGGFSGWVPFLHFARQRDMAIGTVFVANLIYTIMWYSTFLLFLLIGLIYLFIRHDLQWFEISAGLVMTGVDLVMISSLVLAWFAPQVLKKILDWINQAFENVFTGWLKRKRPLTETQITNFSTDLTGAVDTIKSSGLQRFLVPLVHAVLNETLLIAMFYLVALAFGTKLSYGVLVAAYSISILFFVVSPTPGGLGFVEGTLVLVLTSLGVMAQHATVITLAYRGITFWLPFVLGFIALRWFNQHPEPEPVPEPLPGLNDS